jgi:hypothetical protein
MGIRKSEDELFRKWKAKCDSFVIDGVPCPDAFLATPAKVVFILKDINAPDVQGEFDLRGQMERNPHPWWRTIANWCAVISAFPKTLAWSEVQRIPIKQCLEPFAFMQLKKSAGGGSVSDQMLIQCTRNDADEIRAQLGIYHPNVIVCCGVGQIVADIIGGGLWQKTERGVQFMKLALYSDQTPCLIDYMHPSARAMKNIVCYGLLDAYAEIVGGLNIPLNIGIARSQV